MEEIVGKVLELFDVFPESKFSTSDGKTYDFHLTGKEMLIRKAWIRLYGARKGRCWPPQKQEEPLSKYNQLLNGSCLVRPEVSDCFHST